MDTLAKLAQDWERRVILNDAAYLFMGFERARCSFNPCNISDDTDKLLDQIIKRGYRVSIHIHLTETNVYIFDKHGRLHGYAINRWGKVAICEALYAMIHEHWEIS